MVHVDPVNVEKDVNIIRDNNKENKLIFPVGDSEGEMYEATEELLKAMIRVYGRSIKLGNAVADLLNTTGLEFVQTDNEISNIFLS